MSDAPKFKTFRDLKTIPAPKLEVVQPTSDPDQAQTKHLPDQTQSKPRPNPVQTQSKPASQTKRNQPPDRDFNKRANILERDALPLGLFPGASKKIYDALYLRTLGSIGGKSTIQATRAEIMKWSGVKNIKTVNTHLKKLRDSALLGWTNIPGEHEGSLYEILLPDHITQPRPVPDQSQTTQTETRPEPNQKTVSDQAQKTVWVGLGNPIENKEVYNNPKTSLKTIKNDDDARAIETFLPMIKRLDAAVEKVTGKKSSKGDAEKWEVLADLLALELEVAASRTESVSSVPAFLTEVLRRQFFAARQKPSGKSSNRKTDTIGKSETGEYEIKPLDKEGREAALEQLQEFAGDEMLKDFEKWYTPEDWKWLMNQIEKT